MKLLYLGVIIPAVIILFFAFIAGFNAGYSEEVSFVSSIDGDILVAECGSEEAGEVVVMTRTVKNNLFLSRNVESTSNKYAFCWEPEGYYNNMYEESSLGGGKDVRYRESHEIGANQEVTFTTKAEGQCVRLGLDTEEIRLEDGVVAVPQKVIPTRPEKLLIIPKDSNDYIPCHSLTQRQIDRAVIIPVE